MERTSMNALKQKITKMVELALLFALVIVLQLLGSVVKIGPLPMSFVLVPIVIGACLLGPNAGAFLGGVFGVITMVMGIAGIDAFSYLLFSANPIWFVVICLLKAIMAGFCSGLIYKVLGKLFGGKYVYLKTVLASITAPIVNTGIFVVGMLLFFFETMEGLPAMFPEAFGQFESAVSLVFMGLAGVNFIGEFVVNLVLSPAMVRIIDVVKNKIKI
jgi:uncharacterized membrane protein